MSRLDWIGSSGFASALMRVRLSCAVLDDKTRLRSDFVHDHGDVVRFQSEFDQCFIQQSRHFIERCLVDIVRRVDPGQRIVGIARRSAHYLGNKFGLVIDQPAHVDVLEIRGQIVRIQDFVVESHHDFADRSKSTIFLKQSAHR